VEVSKIIVQSSLADKVYDLLKRQILSGEIKGGMTIPEEQLAQEFGVSRTPIREAIRKLSEYGLVVLKPRTHAMVYKVDEKEAKDIAKVRIALEQLAVETLTTRSIEDHVDILSRLSAECQYYLGIGNRAELFVRDSLFHLELVKCTGNKALYTLYERLDSRVQLLRIAQNRSDKELAEKIHQHGLLVQYLRNGEKQLCLDLIAAHISHQS
jgi:DNA-binding GntR family transcriptional regulator